jgi:hypothetical protein
MFVHTHVTNIVSMSRIPDLKFFTKTVNTWEKTKKRKKNLGKKIIITKIIITQCV